MIEIDHYAITVDNLERAIKFYKQLGYSDETIYEDEDYRWSTMKGIIDIELFEIKSSKIKKIKHIGYRFDDFSDIEKYITNQSPFYGDSKRESYFITDEFGNEIQFIKSLKRDK